MNYNELYEIIHKEVYGRLKNELSEEEKQEYDYAISNIVKEMLDLSSEAILGQDIQKTFILRKYYGVLDDGNRQSMRSIATEIGKSAQRVSQILEKLNRNLVYNVVNYKKNEIKKEEIKRVSSLTYSDRYSELKDKQIGELNISVRVFYNLKRMGINTIEDLLSYGKTDLINFNISQKGAEEIETAIHGLGLKFIEELTAEERNNLLMNCSVEERKNLSSSFLNNNSQMDKFRRKDKYGNLGLATIGTVVDFINACPALIEKNIMDELIALGMNVSVDKIIQYHLIGKEEISEQFEAIAQLNLPIEVLKSLDFHYLGLDKRVNYDGSVRYSKDTQGNDLKTIGDFIKMPKADLLKIRGIGPMKSEEIINSIHTLGLYFSDEVDILKAYSSSIHEQLESGLSTPTGKRK